MSLIFLFNSMNEIDESLFDSYEMGYIKASPHKVETQSYFLFIKCYLNFVNDKDIKIRHDKKGKPYVEGVKGLYISISHSNGFIALALSKGRVGVDIELIKHNYWDGYDISPIMTECEKNIKEKNPEKVNLYNYTIWTRKESYIKVHMSENLKLNHIETISNHYNSFLVKTSMDKYVLSIYEYHNAISENTIIFMEEKWYEKNIDDRKDASIS